MKAKALHIIHKEKLEISFPDYEAVREWEINDRQRLMHAVHDAIERSFEEYDTGDYLIIERLELNLGTFTASKLQQEMPDRIYTECKKVLHHYKQQFSRPEPFTKPDSGKSWEQASRVKQNEQLLTHGRGRLESFTYFLSKGYLPWWASTLAGWDETWLQQLTIPEWARLEQFIISAGSAPVLRLTAQFSDSFLAGLVKGMGVTLPVIDAWQWLVKLLDRIEGKSISTDENRPETNNGYAHEFPALQNKEGSEPDGSISRRFDGHFVHLKKLRQQYWMLLIDHAAGTAAIPQLSQLFREDPLTLDFVRQVCKSQMSNSRQPFPDEIPSFWKKELEQEGLHADSALDQSNLPKPDGTKITDLPKDSGSVLPVIQPVNIARHTDLSNSKNHKDHPEEKLFITQAGLVLLHPFLPQLFGGFGWMEKQEFLNPSAQTRAVYALYYLATGMAEVPEHQLLLPKLLCGMSWEIPLEPVEPLTEAEKMACNELLTAVVAHWKALRNTSPDGLREGYLQRNGRLEADERGWRLEVEPKAQDILLSRLPWGISIIKYRWMAGLLSVSWN